MLKGNNILLKENSISGISYLFVISIIALTGFEYFFRAGILIMVVFFISAFYWLKSKKLAVKGFMGMLLSVSILSLVQTFLGYNQSIFTTILWIASFLTYYFVAEKVNRDLPKIVINTIFILSIISLVFFFLTYNQQLLDFVKNNIAIYFKSLGANSGVDSQGDIAESTNILIYNFKNYAFSYNRNSGPFWEPGMFVIFINVALYFNLIITKRFLNLKNIVFVAAIVTTFSTTGYIAAFFGISVYLLFYFKSRFNILLIITLFVSLVYVSQLDFMQSKIVDQIENSHTSGDSRFGAIIVHLKVIGDYPFIGVGDGAAKAIAEHTDASSTANGITFVFVKYGLIFGLLYYILLIRACLNVMNGITSNKMLGYCFFILLIILAFSQDVTVRHFYLFLIVYGLFSPSRKLNIKAKPELRYA